MSSFPQDHVLDVVELDLRSAVLREQDAIARLDVERDEVAVFVALAAADCDHDGLDGLLFRGIGDDETAGVFSSAAVRLMRTRL